MMWDWVLVLTSAAGSFIGIGSVALYYDNWARRRQEALEGTQGLKFHRDSGWQQDYESGSASAWSSIRVRVTPAGPGVRHDPAAILWVEGHPPRGEDLGIGRFSNEIEPIRIVVRVPHAPNEKRPSVKFGLSWVAVHGQGLRNDYVRIDLNEGGIETWRWKRLYRFRVWWNENKRFGIPWSGRRSAPGHWRTVRSSSDVDWQGPVHGIVRPKSNRPWEDVPTIEWEHDNVPAPAAFPQSFLETMKGPGSWPFTD